MTLNEIIESANGPVKLHLGCGSVLLDSYINIDGEYCRGTEGIVIHDITEPFDLPDNCVDEILSVHVIEHIDSYLIEIMFAEWARILKPNGIVAIEWPDLLKMCQYIVNNPAVLYSRNKKELKRGVAGIFGNHAKYGNVAMLHKWGYSAESMMKILLGCGFSSAYIEPNLYKKTEMDSRVVAVK